MKNPPTPSVILHKESYMFESMRISMVRCSPILKKNTVGSV